ncbi:MAG TPA: hypothetical protein PK189_10665 [bacterium]|nr:hypothetical protein [bacterium]
MAEKYDKIFEWRIKFPNNMISGYYKYIVFDYDLKEQTGQVFSRTDFGYVIEGLDINLPNSEWIAEHHKCAPIWYGWANNEKSIEKLETILIEISQLSK